MADSDLPADFDLPAKYKNITLEALNMGVRKKISLYMNLPGSFNDNIGVMNDYTGFAEMIGFTYIEVKNFEMQKSPTEQLLDEWTGRVELSPTVGNLWKYLKEMERFDVLTDSWSLIQRDCENHLKMKAKFAPKGEPIQDSSVTQSSEADHGVDEGLIMTVDDVIGDTQTMYDAYVCYTPEDEDLAFVRQLIEKLEEQHKLKLFVPQRDDLPGASQSTVCAKLIENRCRRMIIVLSKKFLQSASCDFQTKFAHSLSPGARSKKMIPILIERCDVPPILRHITCCDYTKKDLIEWFWSRLAHSLKASLNPADCRASNPELFSSMSLNSSSVTSDRSSASSFSSYGSTNSSLRSTSSSASSSASSLSLTARSAGILETHSSSHSQPSGDYEKIGQFQRLKQKFTRSGQNRRPLPPPRDRTKTKLNQTEHFC